MGKTCGTCAYLDVNNSRSHEYFGQKWNTFYCQDCGGYHKETETACKYYQEKLKSTNSGCFITTTIVEILGFEDDCYILNLLRAFRDNVLQKDRRYNKYLLMYDAIGPRISANLKENINKEKISVLTYEYYILPICDLIVRQDYDSALNKYVGMIKFLQNQVLVEADVNDYQYDDSMLEEEKGHGRALVISSI